MKNTKNLRRTHFTGLENLNFDYDLLSSLHLILNSDPADVCDLSRQNGNVRKEFLPLHHLFFLVFSGFCRVKDIVMAACCLTEKKGWSEKTFPEQEEEEHSKL